MPTRRTFWVVVGSVVLAGAVAASAGVLATRDVQAAPLASQSEVAALRAELAAAQRDATYWRQLVSAFEPAKELGLDSMSDHLMLETPGGPVLALHFDNPNLAKAKNLNWVAFALPGRFTKADQARVNRLYGPGFTHFHDLKADVHGGPAGTAGVWFVHVGARDFTSPFGKVRKGQVDPNFMPTKPPR